MKAFLIACLILAAVPRARAEDFASTATNSRETWRRYAVRGVELGTPRAALVTKGFVCGKTGSRCYKLLDKRCAHATCLLKEDAVFGGQWFELNGVKTELEYISVVLTDTTSALIYEMTYKFGPRQLLTRDSILGKALIEKYGDPTEVTDPQNAEDRVGGGRFSWRNPTADAAPRIDVDCEESAQGRKDAQCRLNASADGILRMERDKQAGLDVHNRKAQQPTTAPEL
jgi:hypothetical protein